MVSVNHKPAAIRRGLNKSPAVSGILNAKDIFPRESYDYQMAHGGAFAQIRHDNHNSGYQGVARLLTTSRHVATTPPQWRQAVFNPR